MTVKSRKLFGTDGIRGRANTYPMTSETALALGRAITITARKQSKKKNPSIVIGKDTRLSGYMLETAIASGICSVGGQVKLVGPLPTPGISFITASMRADAGVVISASHNPFDDNGIKLFGPDGFKLPDENELAIEQLMADSDTQTNLFIGNDIGQAQRIDDALGRYIVELKHSFPKGMTLDGIKIVVDCANGAAYKAAPSVFSELGADVLSIGVSPDGTNINCDCGALFPEITAKQVLKQKADIGIALDGDADRVIVIDENGKIIDGDVLMALCASQMIKNGSLVDNTLVTTVMSNLGLDNALEKLGGKVVRTAVGDRYVVEEMLKNNYVFGGEQSGHLIFLNHASTGDGIVGALQILSIMIKNEKPLSTLADNIMDKVPQKLLSFKIPHKKPIEELMPVTQKMNAVKNELGTDGRILVRYSGTENKARVLVEGPDKNRIEQMAEEIKDVLLNSLKT